ncbi:hypothetical protein G7Y89_g8226 [Cudoniella acicularis]|uniref:Alpha/beta hydrolase fold-3 domain-containing protein n=1 Tax=Cudoniella acicularis TaxID=354080 RepID=A0A8H4W195_9HELO|nr:hypothetical protein G7Y89_g8226 [Cudoniella acicularis]
MILGTRNFLLEGTFPWIKELNAVLVTPEYRLAPENQYPAIIEDCYTGLKWFSQNTAKLGIDPNRVIIAGHSAGGGLAAGMALLARDRKLELKLCAQLLVYPMLDDRMTAASCQQFMDKGTWTGKSNRVAWDWILGDKARKGDEVGKELMYIAPARAEDLSGLPTAWVECGSAEPFRDEDVLYATRLWEAGVQCELHVWAGGFHGYDVFAADSAIAKVSFEARLNWLRRVMGPAPNPKASL